ncbi:TAXI family TRAP transporter solute-binding subunit [Arenibacterium halophilum]|uniref:TAXI family TRAP transporter solute-binding subunit n=1 Tax=Arenibacterium halophilum TaxID=2583821 RepID=A0ABY2X201_9RHOB|nr:TAXI family TRAP transporter solute-binding subunit [Arenibacterium halophilum]TMV09319.1 TAXI family TRAP transporter solute-binding subunit [Arenibacterium halophilum]
MTIKSKATAALLAFGLLAAPAVSAQTYNLTLCGASPGGLWSLLGAGVDAAVKESFPGSTVTYQTSGGGLANVGLLDQGKCDLAIIHDAEAKAALGGLAPFKSKIESMRTVAQLYSWAPMQAIVNADYAEEHGLTKLEDIAEKQLPITIVLNRRGNIVSGIGEAMLNAIGASPEQIEEWGGSVEYAASGEQGDLMRDRRVDMLLNSLFVNHSSIRELASSIDVKLLPITDETAQKVIDEWDIQRFTVPNAAYDWTDEDVLTLTVSAQLFVREDADPKMVGDVTRALVDNVAKLQGVHKAMAPLDVKLMGGATTVPYHAEAQKIFDDSGS